jgi:hypothetical protein
VSANRASSATCGRISSAPSEQFTPTTSGCACSIERQNASDRLPAQGPPAQVDDRHRDPQRQVRRHLAGRRDRGLAVQRVEDGLDQQQVDPALSQRGDLLRVGALTASNVTARYAGSSTRGDSDSVTFSGPSSRRRSGHRPRPAAWRASARRARSCPRTSDWKAVVGLADAGGGERVGGGDVRAGGQVLPVDVEQDVRPGRGAAGRGRR